MSPGVTDPSDLFYQQMVSFEDFGGINEEANFKPIPGDWTVVITDVKGSTQAIDDGRYKDVNTVGAAAIACVQNAIGELEYPFVFGGDGATLLIPPAAIDRVKDALSGLKTLSKDKFGLELRVGVVPVSLLEKDGIQVLVAKYKLIGKKSVAIFRGGGLTEAEARVKGTDEFELPASPAEHANLKGLSCRWQPIPSESGRVLSLLVVARREDDEAVYRQVLNDLDGIFGGEIELANPVRIPMLSYKSVGQCLRDEKRYHKSVWSFSFLLRALEILAAVAIFKFKIPPLFFSPKKYAGSMRTHSDYRKFDDALRMVLDCSSEQIERIEKTLAKAHAEGELFYGLHQAGASLMTCFVNDLNEGNHIHFIDGGDGGYAMAAKQLKGQMKAVAKAVAKAAAKAAG
jgi:hypothetical protein